MKFCFLPADAKCHGFVSDPAEAPSVFIDYPAQLSKRIFCHCRGSLTHASVGAASHSPLTTRLSPGVNHGEQHPGTKLIWTLLKRSRNTLTAVN